MSYPNGETVPPTPDLILADGGKSIWRIVVGEAASIYEKKAAKLLQRPRGG